jgi:hypothetical protein
MKHIFISYSPKDSRHMSNMIDNLLRIGYKPWIDPSPRPGLDWRFDIDDAIRASDAMIVIVTPASVESVFVTYEWALAIGLGIPVIPVKFAPGKMHPRLNTLEQFDVNSFTNPGHFWDYFGRELPRLLPTAPQPQPNIARPDPTRPDAMPDVALPLPQPAYTRTIMPTEPGYYLVVRRGPQLNSFFKLSGETLTLGRDATSDITIEDPEVSRYHLRLNWKGDGYAVEDLGSTNGTRIDGSGKIKSEVKLLPGQALMLGDAIILSYEAIAANG